MVRAMAKTTLIKCQSQMFAFEGSIFRFEARATPEIKCFAAWFIEIN